MDIMDITLWNFLNFFNFKYEKFILSFSRFRKNEFRLLYWLYFITLIENCFILKRYYLFDSFVAGDYFLLAHLFKTI